MNEFTDNIAVEFTEDFNLPEALAEDIRWAVVLLKCWEQITWNSHT